MDMVNIKKKYKCEAFLSRKIFCGGWKWKSNHHHRWRTSSSKFHFSWSWSHNWYLRMQFQSRWMRWRFRTVVLLHQWFHWVQGNTIPFQNIIAIFHSGTVFPPHFLRCCYLPFGLSYSIFPYIHNYRNSLYHRRNLHCRSFSTSSEKKNTSSRSRRISTTESLVPFLVLEAIQIISVEESHLPPVIKRVRPQRNSHYQNHLHIIAASPNAIQITVMIRNILQFQFIFKGSISLVGEWVWFNGKNTTSCSSCTRKRSDSPHSFPSSSLIVIQMRNHLT